MPSYYFSLQRHRIEQRNKALNYLHKWITLVCHALNPTMRTGLDFESAQFDQNARTWNLVQSELEDLKWHLMRINHYLINFDPVLGLDQCTSPGIQYYHLSKKTQQCIQRLPILPWCNWHGIAVKFDNPSQIKICHYRDKLRSTTWVIVLIYTLNLGVTYYFSYYVFTLQTNDWRYYFSYLYTVHYLNFIFHSCYYWLNKRMGTSALEKLTIYVLGVQLLQNH